MANKLSIANYHDHTKSMYESKTKSQITNINMCKQIQI